jgi:subtilisin family serine protease
MNAYFIISSKTLIAIALTALIMSNVFAAPPLSLPIQPSSVKEKFVAGEILVRFKSSMTIQAQQLSVASQGARSVKSVSGIMNISKVKLSLGETVSAAIEAYQNNPNIEYAQPNYIYHATALPDDTSFPQLWGMKNTGQTISDPDYPTNNPPGPTAIGFDIDVESAWDQITDCSSKVVAVIDTGINYTHLDLAANMWDGSGAGWPNHGRDFVDGDNDPLPTGGGEDHGTHVAGIVGAVGNNSAGVAGVCWQANIMSVRVLDETGSGTTANIISGIQFAADNGASVINMSLGGEGPLDALASGAIDYAQARDVVVVVAAGNGGTNGVGDNNDDNDPILGGGGDDGDVTTIMQPCNYIQDNLLCVAALDQSYSLASFSNYGATSVDVGAPGTNVLSSWAGQIITDDFTSGWVINSGWTTGLCALTNTLSNPSDWCSSGTYALNADDRAYKSFNLNGFLAAELFYVVSFETETGVDFFSNSIINSGGDPFAGGGTTLLNISGSQTGFVKKDISSCTTSTCSIGFRLTSDADVVFRGVGISRFSINTLQTNSSSYKVSSGTSMSSPHVAGIATMIRAFNPNYTYAQTVEAIKNGGETVAALSGKTSTGRAANAMGALAYITQPTGVAAVVQ